MLRALPRPVSGLLTALTFSQSRTPSGRRCVRRLWALEGLEDRVLLAATIYTVNSTTDTGAGSGTRGDLLYCIDQANANTNAGGSEIEFDPKVFGTPQIITLSSTLTLSETSGPEVISGPRANLVTVSGNNAVQVFSISGGVTATLTDLTISRGLAAQGGGLAIDGGNVSLTNVTVINNQAAGAAGAAGSAAGPGRIGVDGGNGVGGGIYLEKGNLTLNDDVIAGNVARGGAGGDGGAGGTGGAGGDGGAGGEGEGGGLYLSAGSVIIGTSSIESNIALGGTAGDGGAGGAGSPSGRMEVNGGLGGLGGTGGAGAGGGLYIAGGSVRLSSDTVSANSAHGGQGGFGGPGGAGGSGAPRSRTGGQGGSGGLGGLGGTGGAGAGGGLYIAGGSVRLSGDTVSANSAHGGQGGFGGPGGAGGTGGTGGAGPASGRPGASGFNFTYVQGVKGGSGGDGVHGGNGGSGGLAGIGGHGGTGGAAFGGGLYVTGGTVDLTFDLFVGGSAVGGSGGLGGSGGSGGRGALGYPGYPGGNGGRGGYGFVYFTRAAGSGTGPPHTSIRSSGPAGSGGNGGNGGGGGEGGRGGSGQSGGNGGNGGTAQGGGLYVSGGTVTLRDDTLSLDSAVGGAGAAGGKGGLGGAGGPGAPGGAGGAAGPGGFLFANQTASGHTTGPPGLPGNAGGNGNNGLSGGGGGSGEAGTSGVANGGGLYVTTGTLSLINSTIAYNDVGSGGAGGGLDAIAGSAILDNTIVAFNTNGTGTAAPADDIAGTISSASAYNLIGTGGSGGLTHTNGNKVGVADPGLGALASNGGRTQTIALLAGSPAIGAGQNPIDNVTMFTDQRGFIPSGAWSIGAYQPGNPAAAPTATLNAANVSMAGYGQTSYTFTITYTGAAGITPSSLAGSVVRVDPRGGGTPVTATMVSTVPNGPTDPWGDAQSFTVTYQMTPPGGSWTSADNSTYTVDLGGSPVSDTFGQTIPLGPDGTFQVQTGKIAIAKYGLARNLRTGFWTGSITLTNTGTSAFSGPIFILFNLRAAYVLENATGTYDGMPYLEVNVTNLAAGATTSAITVTFNTNVPPASYSTTYYLGTLGS